MSAAAATVSLPPPTQMLDIDDLVAALSTSHIGQQHVDIQTIRDQLAQLLYSQPQALAALNFPTSRKRSASVASDFSMDAEMETDGSYNQPQQQHQPRHPSAPAGSPHRSQPAYEMYAQPPQQQQQQQYHQHPSHQAFGWSLGNAGHHHTQASHLALNLQTATSGDPAPPPSSPVHAGPLFPEYPRQSHVEVSRPF